jgi:hypothetical protein
MSTTSTRDRTHRGPVGNGSQSGSRSPTTHSERFIAVLVEGDESPAARSEFSALETRFGELWSQNAAAVWPELRDHRVLLKVETELH